MCEYIKLNPTVLDCFDKNVLQPSFSSATLIIKSFMFSKKKKKRKKKTRRQQSSTKIYNWKTLPPTRSHN